MSVLPSSTEKVAVAARWLQPLQRLVGTTLDFFYPPGCPLCQAEIPAELRTRSAGFCSKCWQGLAGVPASSCQRCGATVGPHLGGQASCRFCRDEHFTFSHVIRLGIYQNELQLACVLAKGPHRGTHLAAGLGRLTWDLQEEAFRKDEIDAVVPIPRHWWRSLTRSHNTAETLATVWGNCLRVPVLTSILKKVRQTPLQTKLTPAQRRQNLKQAFAATIPKEWRGATLLLADDVMTTGATVQEATRRLLAGGVGRVIVAVVARGIGQRGFTPSVGQAFQPAIQLQPKSDLL